MYTEIVLKDRVADGGEGEKSNCRGSGDTTNVYFVSDGGVMIDGAVNGILLEKHFGGSIDNARG